MMMMTATMVMVMVSTLDCGSYWWCLCWTPRWCEAPCSALPKLCSQSPFSKLFPSPSSSSRHHVIAEAMLLVTLLLSLLLPFISLTPASLSPILMFSSLPPPHPPPPHHHPHHHHHHPQHSLHHGHHYWCHHVAIQRLRPSPLLCQTGLSDLQTKIKIIFLMRIRRPTMKRIMESYDGEQTMLRALALPEVKSEAKTLPVSPSTRS